MCSHDAMKLRNDPDSPHRPLTTPYPAAQRHPTRLAFWRTVLALLQAGAPLPITKRIDTSPTPRLKRPPWATVVHCMADIIAIICRLGDSSVLQTEAQVHPNLLDTRSCVSTLYFLGSGVRPQKRNHLAPRTHFPAGTLHGWMQLRITGAPKPSPKRTLKRRPCPA
jgi:hypothetical protein